MSSTDSDVRLLDQPSRNKLKEENKLLKKQLASILKGDNKEANWSKIPGKLQIGERVQYKTKRGQWSRDRGKVEAVVNDKYVVGRRGMKSEKEINFDKLYDTLFGEVVQVGRRTRQLSVDQRKMLILTYAEKCRLNDSKYTYTARFTTDPEDNVSQHFD